MEEVIKLNEVDKYNKLFGLETRHPLVSVVDYRRRRGGRNISRSTTACTLFI